MSSASPMFLVVVSLVCYQLASKLSPSTVTPWATLALVYAIALAISILRVVTGEPVALVDLTDRRFLVTALILGVAVVGIEYGYLAAHRHGWELSIVSLVGAAGGTAVLAVVGMTAFSETLAPQRLLGLVLCLGGLALLAWR